MMKLMVYKTSVVEITRKGQFCSYTTFTEYWKDMKEIRNVNFYIMWLAFFAVFAVLYVSIMTISKYVLNKAGEQNEKDSSIVCSVLL